MGRRRDHRPRFDTSVCPDPAACERLFHPELAPGDNCECCGDTVPYGPEDDCDTCGVPASECGHAQPEVSDWFNYSADHGGGLMHL